ncbi:Ankyrin-3 [Dactylella cylindrospora]|nr:Ankyrin-3 [Dactylella cylindrospora]
MQTAVAYYYFDFSNKGTNTEKFTRSLAKQLAFQSRTVPRKLVELYETYSRSGKTEPADEIRDLVVQLASSFATTYIVVDALDECDAEHRLDVLDVLQELADAGIRIFTTSRPHPEDINDVFEGADKIELTARPDDISKYIRAEIARYQRGKPKTRQIEDQLKERIVTDLVYMSHGMFLLPKFQLKFLLKQPNPHRIMAALDKALKMSTKDLGPIDETYNLMFENIDDSHKEIAIKALSWLIVAKSPLRIQDLLVALAVEPGYFEISEPQVLLQTTVLDICSGFIVVDKSSGIVRLAHETIQDYLLRNHVKTADALASLTIACVNYLSFDRFADPGFWDSIGDDEASRLEGMKEVPFYMYAVQHWEAQTAECDPEAIKDDLIEFLSRPSSVNSYCRGRRLTMSFKWPDPRHVLYDIGTNESPLHIAARLGHQSIAEHFILEGVDVDIEHNAELRPITEATAFGQFEMVKFLVENGSSLRSPRHPLQHPINLAASLGHLSIVEYFVRVDRENLDMQNNASYTALHECALRGHAKVVRLLLDAGADWRIEQCERKNAAALAIEFGMPNIFSMFLKQGMDLKLPLSTNAYNAGTPLHVAAFYGEKPVVKDILDLSAADVISAIDSMGNTALHNAVVSGSLPIVRMLVENGIDIERENRNSETALELATQLNSASIEKYLQDILRERDRAGPNSGDAPGESEFLPKPQLTPEEFSLSDVVRTYYILNRKLKLPPRVTKRILDYSYRLEQHVQKTGSLKVDKKVLQVPYLSIPVLGPFVRKIVFRTISHDQGSS